MASLVGSPKGGVLKRGRKRQVVEMPSPLLKRGLARLISFLRFKGCVVVPDTSLTSVGGYSEGGGGTWRANNLRKDPGET